MMNKVWVGHNPNAEGQADPDGLGQRNLGLGDGYICVVVIAETEEQAANMLSQAIPDYNHHYADLLSVNYRPADFQSDPKNVKVGDTWYQNTVWAWECIGEAPESSARIVLLAAGGY